MTGLEGFETVEIVGALYRLTKSRLELQRTWARMSRARRRWVRGVFDESEQMFLAELALRGHDVFEAGTGAAAPSEQSGRPSVRPRRAAGRPRLVLAWSSV